MPSGSTPSGFEKVGTKTFTVGREVHHDYVLRLVF